MTTAVFGKPETGGVQFVEPALLEQATLVYRAIHTLEMILESGLLRKDSTVDLFTAQSWNDMQRLLEMYKVQGVRVNDIDMGEYV